MTETELEQELEAFEVAVAARIKGERVRRRMSQMELALEAGLSQGYLAMIETHQKIPTIFKLARALNMSPESLFASPDASRQEAKEHIIALIQRNL